MWSLLIISEDTVSLHVSPIIPTELTCKFNHSWIKTVQPILWTYKTLRYRVLPSLKKEQIYWIPDIFFFLWNTLTCIYWSKFLRAIYDRVNMNLKLIWNSKLFCVRDKWNDQAQASWKLWSSVQILAIISNNLITCLLSTEHHDCWGNWHVSKNQSIVWPKTQNEFFIKNWIHVQPKMYQKPKHIMWASTCKGITFLFINITVEISFSFPDFLVDFSEKNFIQSLNHPSKIICN